MGLPAVRHERPASRARKPHLRVVERAPSKTPARKRSATARAEAARGTFRSFAILMVLVVALGMGRVWLSVKAAEASMRSSELRSAIKNARYQGDMLEVRQSALGSPSRIRAIASQTMGMAPARRIAMINIAPRPGAASGASADRQVVPAGTAGVDKAIKSLMDLTAGEAQVLLVGDVGLVSSK